MNEQVARKVTLVRAIETADTRHEILSEDDRRYASRSARELAQWAAADDKTAVTTDHFLEQRAEQILKRLAERRPAWRAVLGRPRLLPLLGVLLPPLALALGALLDHVADPHRIDLVSAPLLLIVGWNLLVYVVLLAWLFVPSRRTGWVGPDLMRRLSAGKTRRPRKLPAALVGALEQFAVDWTALSWRLTQARLSRAVHLAAAAFALGAILSLYARGVMTQYAAGWESTFLDAGQVHALLSWLFAPARLVFPIQGFSLEDVQALRFVREPSAAGGARWVHLYAATLFLFVVLPRVVLAAWAGWRARRLAARFPIDLRLPYFHRLADGAGLADGPALLRVVPYSYTLDERRDAGLNAIAQRLFGTQARVMLRPPVAYGDEDSATLADQAAQDGTTVTAALFNLAATPERENHGVFLGRLLRQAPGALVLLDESSLVERSGGAAAAQARVAERAALWRQFCDHHGARTILVDLLDPGKYAFDAPTGEEAR